MATNWSVPTGQDVLKVISRVVMKATNENIVGDGTEEYDDATKNRRDEALALVVSEMRSAILLGGRFAVSETAGSVPPEAERHALNMAAFQLVNSTPSLQMVLVNEGGVYSPFQILHKAGVDWIEWVKKGGAVTAPTDPDDTPPDAVRWGCVFDDVDLTMNSA